MIPSFSIDHSKIVPGVFVSRVDDVNGNPVTTYDVRLKCPNIEPAVDALAMHSIEHIVATYLRNDSAVKEDVIYWGPMGCLTGFYLILKGDRPSKDIVDVILDAFRPVLTAKEVPGATEVNCGYAALHNLTLAKYYAAQFIEYILKNKNNPVITNYPHTERLLTKDGKKFCDS